MKPEQKQKFVACDQQYCEVTALLTGLSAAAYSRAVEHRLSLSLPS